MAETRKLAAILAADVAGYSKLASTRSGRLRDDARCAASSSIRPLPSSWVEQHDAPHQPAVSHFWSYADRLRNDRCKNPMSRMLPSHPFSNSREFFG